jgi:hypothetical protein
MRIDLSAAGYFHEAYLTDWARFAGEDRAVHGPSSVLCGMTMMALLDAERIASFKSPQHFLCVQYELNLLNQALYTHAYASHGYWISASAPFADCRCPSRHGGVFSPESLFRYAEHPTSYKNLVPLVVPDQLKREFDEFFVPKYLASLEPLQQAIEFDTLNLDELLAAILKDPDCEGFKKRYQSR